MKTNIANVQVLLKALVQLRILIDKFELPSQKTGDLELQNGAFLVSFVSIMNRATLLLLENPDGMKKMVLFIRELLEQNESEEENENDI